MRTKQIISVFLVFTALLGVFAIPALADDELETPVTEEPEEPYAYTNCVNFMFQIINGTAYVIVNYNCYCDLATRVEINIKLQKRFLIFWWNDVDGGEWNHISYNYSGSVNHSLALTSGGEYRAVITVRVYGGGSNYDEINQTLTDTN